MKDELTLALGIPDLPPAQFERVRKLVLEDNFFFNRALSTLVLGIAPQVAASMHPLEKERLRQKCGVNATPGTASWGITEGVKSGEQFIHASCSVCKQDQNFSPPCDWKEEIPFDRGSGFTGTVPKWHKVTKEDIRCAIENLKWFHCGHLDTCPEHIVELWREHLATLVR